MDLYILAANGTESNAAPRHHLQINNQFDTCCFFGINFLGYSKILTRYIRENALGNYSYHLDSDFVGHAYDFDLSGTVNKSLEISLIIASAVAH